MNLTEIKKELQYYINNGLYIYAEQDKNDYLKISDWLHFHIYNNNNKELCLKYLDILNKCIIKEV